MKKVVISTLLLAGLAASSTTFADNHTVTLGYAQSKVQDFKNIRGINVQYRYEWDSPLSVLASFSYMKGDEKNNYNDEAGDSYKDNIDMKYYSLLVGPAYRLNDYVSFYGAVGLATAKAKGSYEWRNSSINPDEEDGYNSWNASKNSTNFAYGAGVIINPLENVSVSLGYEGTKVKFVNHHSINGFNIGVGYRF